MGCLNHMGLLERIVMISVFYGSLGSVLCYWRVISINQGCWVGCRYFGAPLFQLINQTTNVDRRLLLIRVGLPNSRRSCNFLDLKI